jgi:hypothetical protein
MEELMLLKEILHKLVEDNEPVLLSNNGKDWTAAALLESLSEPMLKRQAHLQRGLYIAEINDAGYLGQVLYKIKPK